MRILFRRTLNDGRKILVYQAGEMEVVILAKNGAKSIPLKILKGEESCFWRDNLAKILGVSEEELK